MEIPDRIELPIVCELRVAVHEAGHAVANHGVYGVVPVKLCLPMCGNALGEMQPAPPLNGLPPYATTEAETDLFVKPMIVYYGGAVAVGLFADQQYDDEIERGFEAGFERDEAVINDLAWRAAGGDSGQWLPDRARSQALEQARSMLIKRKREVWVIAQMLLAKKTLTEFDLESVLVVE